MTLLKRDDQGDEEWYREYFGAAQVWLIATGDGGCLWPQFKERGIAAIGYRDRDIGDLKCKDKEAIRNALIEKGAGQNPFNDTLALYQFAQKIALGDVLVAKTGRFAVLGWGTITGDYAYEPKRETCCYVRKVEWHPCRTESDTGLPQKALTRFTDRKKWLRKIFRVIGDK